MNIGKKNCLNKREKKWKKKGIFEDIWKNIKKK